MDRSTETVTADASGPERSPSIRWFRASATGLGILFALNTLWAFWLIYQGPRGIDFLSFWAAGQMVLSGNAVSAYDIAAHRLVELTLVSPGGMLPFPYPPPFLFVVTLFAMPPFWLGFSLWVLATGALYLYASTRFTQWPYALANPPLLQTAAIGQTGLFISGVFILGLSLIARRPIFGGMVLGLMVIKPQLALLLPLATLAGREWRVIGGAILSSAFILVAALAVFGLAAYEGFFNILPQYVTWLETDEWRWTKLASPFALARFADVPQPAALAIHTVIALAATLATVRAWWLDLDEKIQILAAATLLIPPYLFTYDALLLIVPAAWLIRAGLRLSVVVIWLCSFMPLLTFVTPWDWPNLIPVAAIISLWLLHSSPRQRCGDAAR